MESPSSTVRRRAWINSSRQWLTLEDPDHEGPPQCSLPSASIADDDVFSDGCFTGKIETWLHGCGSGVRTENAGQLSFESVLKANKVDDELSLGADASDLNGGDVTSKAGFPQHPSSRQGHSRLTCSTPRQNLHLPSLNLGHSMASSCLSSSTCKTTSSVSDILQMCSEDAEETLYELGFGCDEPQVTVRIPPRFFTFPSLAQGINFRLFLDSQLRRIREEDPGLSLASRFRQVQVLTAMANAFYSLYSHVSRTPLQKLATPEFTFSSSPVERIERFRSNIRSEPRSPVERLKDTVSKMCLYTGSPRGSDSTSPQPSPRKRSSLPDVVEFVLDKAKSGATKKLDLGEESRSNSAVAVQLVSGADEASCGKKEQTQHTVMDNKTLKHENKCCEEMQGSEQTVEICIKAADLESRTHCERTSVASSLSGETVIETDHQFLPCSSRSDTNTDHLEPLSKVAYDLICPQIVESVHQAPFCTHSLKTNTSPLICVKTESTDRPCPGSQEAISEPAEESYTGDVLRTLDASKSLPVQAHSGSQTKCCITVTGWEGEDVDSCPSNAPESCHISAVQPVQTCEKFIKGKSQYLNPHQCQGLVSNTLPQVNSFELEEVHSAGEEDFGQSAVTRTHAPPISEKQQYKGEVTRGDSMQSDSSGYADEEVSPSSNTHGR
ncbi:protein ITPRID2 [Notolabrus celidotus]|uniref:protein ITPRID2 n=1 Tax=Notolabrus celidotus TaxID=1203425 RepID=UPI001490387B|nr:protein ITPRID2 [Notolabrus celidotus]XP_034536310.1 protein ITPRID2 [Notolabrus celidotus]